MLFLMFSLAYLIVRIVFFVFSIMFGKTSLLFLPVHSIIRCELCFLLTHSVVSYCVMRTAVLLFVFRIMFFQIRVFRENGRYSLVLVINYAYFSRDAIERMRAKARLIFNHSTLHPRGLNTDFSFI